MGPQPACSTAVPRPRGALAGTRKHIEYLEGVEEGTAGPSGYQAGADGAVMVTLGTWLDNVHKHANKLTEQRRTDLDALGMRW